MPRPNIDEDLYEWPTEDTPMGEFTDLACGQTYDKSYTARSAYQGTDDYSYDMQTVTTWSPKPADQLSKDELEALPLSAGIAAKAILAAQAMLDGNDEGLKVKLVESGTTKFVNGILQSVDPQNRQAIQYQIDKAAELVGLAAQLWNYWAKEWQPIAVSEVQVGPELLGMAAIQEKMPNWPLNLGLAQAIPACVGQGPGQTVKIEGDGWAANVECPTLATIQQHKADVDAYQYLIMAAIVWARCAQEAAAVIGLRALNKAKSEGLSEIPKLTLFPGWTPPGAIPGLSTADSSGLGSSGLGSPDLDPGLPPIIPPGYEPSPATPPSTSTSTKKGNNTLMWVAGIGLAALLLASMKKG